MNIEVKPLHFPFHSEVDLNPTKCKLFCNVSHCINFNARLTSPYAFTRCIHHQDIAPHQVSIRHMSWGPPGVLQPSNSKSCGLGNVAGRAPDACHQDICCSCYNREGMERKALVLYFYKWSRLLLRGRELQSCRACCGGLLPALPLS